MILKTLVENTTTSPKYRSKHGMCFYIETTRHKILFDLGSNELFLENAKKMGVNISEIDMVIISHGHIDHGGALKVFLENNHTAKVYVRENAFDKHYTKLLGFKVDVGIDSSLKHHPQVVLTGEDIVIDEEITLFSKVEAKEGKGQSNNALFARINKNVVVDDFSHEQSMIIEENEKKILVAGCSHSGIINIKNKAEQILKGKISYVVAGFHLYNPISRKNENDGLVEEIAERLKDNITHYYTCHCTGTKAYNRMKTILVEKIDYLSTGSEIEL